MEKVYEAFSDEFKGLWEPNSQMHNAWEQIEIYYNGVKAFSQLQSRIHSNCRSVKEIEDDMNHKRKSMEALYLEFVQVMWTKIVLRTISKVIDAMQLVFYSASTCNTYACALGARSILEHVAFLQYFAKKTPWIKSGFIYLKEAIPFTKDLLNLASGSRFDWDRLYKKGIRQIIDDGNWDRPTADRIPNISLLVESLEDALLESGKMQYKNELKFLYVVLCDVVHPSWGGDFIYGSAIDRDVKQSHLLTERFKLSAVIFCGSLAGLLAHLIRLCESLQQNIPNLILKSE